MTGYHAEDRPLTGDGEPMRVSVALTVGDFAGVYEMQQRAGRFHTAGQSFDGSHRVAVEL